jgi:hypothetical protein
MNVPDIPKALPFLTADVMARLASKPAPKKAPRNVDEDLIALIASNRHSVTYDMIESLYRKHGKWPRIDKVHKKTFVRDLARGFVSLSLDERRAVHDAKLLKIAMDSRAYLVSYDMRRGVVDIWGADVDAISRTMLMVLRALRAPR